MATTDPSRTSETATTRTITLDANEAVARVAYRLNEVIAIYPITPASPMGESVDACSQRGLANLWGDVPSVVEMQSEAGAAGAIHGALQTGALATTFTASQGLLLMLPNMFKIAGELTAGVIHVAARSVATHALSIFGDHSDVMAVRSSGYAMLCATNPQEAQDFALIAQSAGLRGRLPVLHFFDGFRTSHEIRRVEPLDDDTYRALVDPELVEAHRARGLTPDRPVVRGTAQNPDVFFQAREAVSPYYAAFPSVVARAMERFAESTGRRYRLFDYVGHPEAERVVVLMGSGSDTARETIEHLVASGERVGGVIVRLFRPFDTRAFVDAIPKTARHVAVLDRTKEPGAPGEPLYQDVVTALAEEQPRDQRPDVIGGRYGLSSKEFTPAMLTAVFRELERDRPRNHFTVGITDDTSGSSLDWDRGMRIDTDPDVVRAVFFGLGSDGTVGANKQTIKIIGERTGDHVQGYFVYDSKKAGAVTVSHLRFGPRPIRSAYLIEDGTADFVGVHNTRFLERYEVFRHARPGATVLLNSPWEPTEVLARLPRELRQEATVKQLEIWTVDANGIAAEAGLGRRINTVMQACFFELSDVMPKDDALAAIRASIRKTYGKRGDHVVEQNLAALDASIAGLKRVPMETTSNGNAPRSPFVAADAPQFVRDVTAQILAGRGDELPVGAMPVDGTFPTGTARFEKRGIATEVPEWDRDLCIQCAKCAIVCPHAAIRLKVFEPAALENAPTEFESAEFRGSEFRGSDLQDVRTTIQVAPDDCTGCELCVHVCPAKDKSDPRHKAIDMTAVAPRLERERRNFEFFLEIPELDRTVIDPSSVRGSQMLEPLFEFSGACGGCGETPYLKLLTQLFGDRLLVANATGCSSIYGGNLPTTPWTTNAEGRGPAWSNSLFEDAAEFGLGFRLTLDEQRANATRMLQQMSRIVGDELAREILASEQHDEADYREQRVRIAELRARLKAFDSPEARHLDSVAESLVRKSTWVVGGDGWAYDIGFGGLDHALASGRDINILVLDTEVYSNTGGQMSKSTPRAAVAKFAAAGKPNAKKDIGMIAMAHDHVYVAQIAMGASDKQTVRALVEADRYPGPSLIIAYSHCIAHGIHMADGMVHQKLAVDCGHWPLYRYDPSRQDRGENPLQLDSRAPRIRFERFAERESRFHMLTRSHPKTAKRLQAQTQKDIDARWNVLRQMAEMKFDEEKKR